MPPNVPLDKVHEYMDLLIADEILKADGLLTDFYLYVQYWYVGQMANGQEVKGKFPKEMWNMYQRVKDGLPRTNNSLEGWHNAFARGMSHLSVYRIAEKYRLEQNSKRILRFQNDTGNAGSTQRRKYQKVTENILFLIRMFDDGSPRHTGLKYLDLMANKVTISIE